MTYIIDHYDDLPDTVIFVHSHRFTWHNNVALGLDTVEMIKRLNHDRVARLGYMNLRCHHVPGCTDWIHLDRPGGDFDFVWKPEEIYFRRHVWEELHPGAPIPSSLSAICCAQFAVSRDRIRQVPLERFVHYRKWLLDTPMDDNFSGRVFEYIWHYIFTGHETYCPSMNTCYCDGYGVCFGGRAKFKEFMHTLDEKNKLNEELESLRKNTSQFLAQHQEVTPEMTDRITYLKDTVHNMEIELETLRGEAFERGNDPKNRALETESYDDTHIWDYAPREE